MKIKLAISNISVTTFVFLFSTVAQAQNGSLDEAIDKWKKNNADRKDVVVDICQINPRVCSGDLKPGEISKENREYIEQWIGS